MLKARPECFIFGDIYSIGMNGQKKVRMAGWLLRMIGIALAVYAGVEIYHYRADLSRHEEALRSLKELQVEMTYVRQGIEKTVHAHIKVKEASVDLLKLLERGPSEEQLAEVDRLDVMARRTYRLTYAEDLINGLIQNVKVLDMKDDSLIYLLTSWPGLIDIYKEKEVIAENFYLAEFLPYLIHHTNMTTEPSTKEKMSLYSDQVYRNLIKEKMELVIHVLYDGQVVKNYTDDVLGRLDEELKAR